MATNDRNSDYAQVKEVLDGLGRAVKEFKETNDLALEKKANAEAFSELEIKVERLNEEIGKKEEAVTKIERAWEADRARIEQLEATLATGGTIGSKKVITQHRDAFLKFLQSGGRHSARQELEQIEAKYTAMLPADRKQVNLASAAAGEALVPEIIASQIETMEQKSSPLAGVIDFLPVNSTEFKQVVDLRGTASGWVAETGTRSVTANSVLREVTPTWGELYARPQASEWAAMDVPNAEGWIAQSVADEFNRALGVAVLTGSGSSQPTGIFHTTPVTTADGASPLRAAAAIQYIAAPSPDDITEHVMMLIYGLQSGYRAGARFCFNSTTAGLIRRAKASDGHYLWEPSLQLGQPAMVAGYPFTIWEDMDDCGLSPLGFPILFGNFRRGYLGVTRSAIRLLVDPYTTIGLISWWFRRRMGGIVLNNDALKVAKR